MIKINIDKYTNNKMNVYNVFYVSKVQSIKKSFYHSIRYFYSNSIEWR